MCISSYCYHSLLLAVSSYQEVDLFSEIRGPDFDSVFGNKSGAQLPNSSAGGISLNQYTMGDILTPQAVGPHAQKEQQKTKSSGLTLDVDSSLAFAAANLSMLFKGPHTLSNTAGDFSTNQWEGKPVCQYNGTSLF